MASAYEFAVNIVMLINITINKTRNIHDSVKKIIYAASTYDFAVNIVMVINITINKTFGVHDLLKSYSRYWEDMNTFNDLTFMHVRTNKTQFTQIRNIDIFSVLIVIKAHTDNNKFM